MQKIAIQIANQLIKKTSFIEYQNYSKISPCQQFKVIKFSVKISKINFTKRGNKSLDQIILLRPKIGFGIGGAESHAGMVAVKLLARI